MSPLTITRNDLSRLSLIEAEQDLRLAEAQAKTAQAFEETNNDLAFRLNQTHALSLQERTLTLQTKEENDALEAQQTTELETLKAKRDAQAATLLSQPENLQQTKSKTGLFLDTLRSIQTCMNVRNHPIGTKLVKYYNNCGGDLRLKEFYHPDFHTITSNQLEIFLLRNKSIYPNTARDILSSIKTLHDRFPEEFKDAIQLRQAQEGVVNENERQTERARAALESLALKQANIKIAAARMMDNWGGK